MTRQATDEILREDFQLEGPALELVLNDLGGERHEWRTAQVVRAILSDVESDEDRLPEREARALVFATCVADMVGVGGRADLEGHASVRVPSLGFAPRKQQRTGEPWSAAVSAAAEACSYGNVFACLRAGKGRTPYPDYRAGEILRVVPAGSGDGLAVAFEDGEEIAVPTQLIPVSWVRAVAASGLRQALELRRPAEFAPGLAAGRGRDWASLFNWAEAQQNGEREEIFSR